MLKEEEAFVGLNHIGSHQLYICTLNLGHTEGKDGTVGRGQRGAGEDPCVGPWDSPGKNTDMGCHFLLQGIFPIQGSNLHLLFGKRILYH